MYMKAYLLITQYPFRATKELTTKDKRRAAKKGHIKMNRSKCTTEYSVYPAHVKTMYKGVYDADSGYIAYTIQIGVRRYP